MPDPKTTPHGTVSALAVNMEEAVSPPTVEVRRAFYWQIECIAYRAYRHDVRSTGDWPPDNLLEYC